VHGLRIAAFIFLLAACGLGLELNYYSQLLTFSGSLFSGFMSKGADDERIGIYRRHWYRWLHAGVTLNKVYHAVSTTHSTLCGLCLQP
jgi:hypothetical protein